MASNDDALTWALQEAGRLESLGHKNSRASIAPSIEFLRLKAGPRSYFFTTANNLQHATPEYAGRVCAGLLREWVEFVRSGHAERPFEVEARVAAATDLMEQVDQLLNDRRVIPAAPVMLAGAALEELLRSMVAAVGAKPKGKPGIGSYANALRAEDAITVQDAKDITAWAGMRNAAAHGDFAQISSEAARLMAMGVNLFMQNH